MARMACTSTLCAWSLLLETQARPITARCQTSLASTSAAEGRGRRCQGAEVQGRTSRLFLLLHCLPTQDAKPREDERDVEKQGE